MIKTGYNKEMSAGPKRRIYELDLLRGFFICVIILDHLQFWPSPLQYLTGQGRLWVSAAEGFFLISGLLIGYLRAYKGATTPLKTLTEGLLKRAFTLYIWCVGITLLVTALAVLLPASPLMPKPPSVEHTSSLFSYMVSTFSMGYASDWIYFLRLYAIMLAVTPLFLLLLRKKLWLLAALLSLSAYAASVLFNTAEVAMQWQLLFFGAALIGWKFETILTWLRERPRVRKGFIMSLVTITLSTMALSYFMVHGWDYVESPHTKLSRESYVSIRSNVDPLFSNTPLAPLRVVLAFIWFGGLLALFHIVRPWLLRFLGWLLLPFGQSSLTVYCLQAIVLCFVVTLVPLTESYWLNGLIGVVVLLTFAILVRLNAVQKLLPR